MSMFDRIVEYASRQLEIPAEELSDVETVGDIIEYLKNKGVED